MIFLEGYDTPGFALTAPTVAGFDSRDTSVEMAKIRSFVRANTYWGSSDFDETDSTSPTRSIADTFPETTSADQSTILSSDCRINPKFCKFNKIRIHSCDGTNFTGLRRKGVKVKPEWKYEWDFEKDECIKNEDNQTCKPRLGVQSKFLENPDAKIYFNGRYILLAALHTIGQRANFYNAKNVVLTGASAGAEAVVMNTDFLGDHLFLNANHPYNDKDAKDAEDANSLDKEDDIEHAKKIKEVKEDVKKSFGSKLFPNLESYTAITLGGGVIRGPGKEIDLVKNTFDSNSIMPIIQYREALKNIYSLSMVKAPVMAQQYKDTNKVELKKMDSVLPVLSPLPLNCAKEFGGNKNAAAWDECVFSAKVLETLETNAYVVNSVANSYQLNFVDMGVPGDNFVSSTTSERSNFDLAFRKCSMNWKGEVEWMPEDIRNIDCDKTSIVDPNSSKSSSKNSGCFRSTANKAQQVPMIEAFASKVESGLLSSEASKTDGFYLSTMSDAEGLDVNFWHYNFGADKSANDSTKNSTNSTKVIRVKDYVANWWEEARTADRCQSDDQEGLKFNFSEIPEVGSSSSKNKSWSNDGDWSVVPVQGLASTASKTTVGLTSAAVEGSLQVQKLEFSGNHDSECCRGDCNSCW